MLQTVISDIKASFSDSVGDGSALAPREAGWKEVILVWPNEHVRIIAKFEDYTGLYMYHCHILEHEDAGMLGWFQVVAKQK
jgi:blue copper oxidase